jgi:hypothetical protein
MSGSAHLRKRGDTNKPVVVTLSVTSGTLDVSTGVTSILLYVRPSSGGTAEAYAMTASSALVVAYVPTALDTFVTTADVYDVEVQVTFTNGKIQTFPESGTLTIKTTEDLD